MKNKVFYPYMIIEFILFLISVFLNMNSLDSSYNIICFIALCLNILFMCITLIRSREDRIYGILFSLSIFFFSLFTLILNNEFIGLLFILLSSIIYTIRLISNLDENKMLFYIALGFSFILFESLFFFDVLTINNSIILNISLNTIISLILLVILYRNNPVIERANWFFGGSGFVILLLYLLSKTYGVLVPDTAMIKGLINIGISAFLIPSCLMMTISFMKFEEIN